MTFSRYNPSSYNPGDRLPAACVNQLDLNLSRALDGYAGGIYTPASGLTINGGGLTIGGNGLVVNDAILHTYGTATFSGTSVSVTTGMTLSGSGTLTFSGSTNYPILSTRVLERGARSTWIPENYGDATDWSFYEGNWYCGATDPRRLALEEEIETSGTLTAIYLRLDHGAHGTWPPQYRTHVSVYKKTLDTGVLTLIEESDDDAAQGTYEVVHTVNAFTTLSSTFAAGEKLFIRVESEGGTNAVAGTRVIGASLSQSFSDLRPV